MSDYAPTPSGGFISYTLEEHPHTLESRRINRRAGYKKCSGDDVKEQLDKSKQPVLIFRKNKSNQC